MKSFALIIVSLLITTLAACTPTGTESEPVTDSPQVDDISIEPDSGDSSESMSMLAGSNALFVSSQLPGNTVHISTLLLQEPGYVVIYTSVNGELGDIIGYSDLLSTDTIETTVTLEETVQDGDELIAALHSDDGNGSFDSPEIDPILTDEVLAGPVMTPFSISQDADDLPLMMP